MEDCKTILTPISQGESLSRDDGCEMVDEKIYRSLVGSFMFLTTTKPDIAYVVHQPSQNHMRDSKIILRYVKGKRDCGIHYFSNKDLVLFGFFNSNYGGCLDYGKSTYENCFSLGSRMITWSSKK